MKNKGVTIVELLIVIVVMGLIASFTIVIVDDIIENTRESVDVRNAEILENAIKQAYYHGEIEIRNNRLYNTVSERSYSGTGSWFFEDMTGYIDNRVTVQAEIGQNSHNIDGGGQYYKFWFRVQGENVTIFYWDEDKDRVELLTFTLN